jgi:hypothetical protein
VQGFAKDIFVKDDPNQAADAYKLLRASEKFLLESFSLKDNKQAHQKHTHLFLMIKDLYWKQVFARGLKKHNFVNLVVNLLLVLFNHKV